MSSSAVFYFICFLFFWLSYFLSFFSHSQKICELRGWGPGSDKYDETHEVMFKIWEGLRSKADKDNDGQVSWKPKVNGMLLSSFKSWYTSHPASPLNV